MGLIFKKKFVVQDLITKEYYSGPRYSTYFDANLREAYEFPEYPKIEEVLKNHAEDISIEEALAGRNLQFVLVNTCEVLPDEDSE